LSFSTNLEDELLLLLLLLLEEEDELEEELLEDELDDELELDDEDDEELLLLLDDEDELGGCTCLANGINILLGCNTFHEHIPAGVKLSDALWPAVVLLCVCVVLRVC
jgi:hypothetical protein